MESSFNFLFISSFAASRFSPVHVTFSFGACREVFAGYLDFSAPRHGDLIGRRKKDSGRQRQKNIAAQSGRTIAYSLLLHDNIVCSTTSRSSQLYCLFARMRST
jgi:hypothetical protein